MRILRLLRYALIILLIPVFLALLLYFLPVNPLQEFSNPQFVYPVNLQRHFDEDSLSAIYSRNKILAPGFELQCLLALSCFPELAETSIEFRFQQTGAPMESTVEFWSMPASGSARKYIILLNDNPDSNFKPILLRNLPFDAQVGILAHEIGHTLYYSHLNSFQMLAWGIKYGLKPSYQALHERSTDELVIYRGMGHQILNYAQYVRFDSSTENLYSQGAEFMDTYYMHPDEIQGSMNNSGLYD